MAFYLWIAGVSFWVGTAQLTARHSNVWLASGLAIFLWTMAFVFVDRLRDLHPRSNLHTTLLRRWRIQLAGYLVAVCLFGVGSAIYGGAIGILGTVVAVIAGSWFVWSLQQLAKMR